MLSNIQTWKWEKADVTKKKKSKRQKLYFFLIQYFCWVPPFWKGDLDASGRLWLETSSDNDPVWGEKFLSKNIPSQSNNFVDRQKELKNKTAKVNIVFVYYPPPINLYFERAIWTICIWAGWIVLHTPHPTSIVFEEFHLFHFLNLPCIFAFLNLNWNMEFFHNSISTTRITSSGYGSCHDEHYRKKSRD